MAEDRLSRQELYSKLWRIGDSIIRENNPCQIQKDAEGHVSCNRTRNDPTWWPSGTKSGQLCCHGCKHLGPNGCTVEALSCKLYACSDAGDYRAREVWPEEIVVAMSDLRKAVQNAGFVISRMRCSKEDYFGTTTRSL